MHGILNELKDQLPKESEEAKILQDIQKSLDQIVNSKMLDEIRKSSAMSKLSRFFDNLNEAESRIGKTIKGLKSGVSIARKLAGHYNEIAQWCGLPTVPKPFAKD